MFGNLEIHGLNRSVYWTRLSKTADPGTRIIHLEEAVDWKPGEEIVIAPTSFEPYDTEILKIGIRPFKNENEICYSHFQLKILRI